MQATRIAHLIIYASPAWWGYTEAEERVPDHTPDEVHNRNLRQRIRLSNCEVEANWLLQSVCYAMSTTSSIFVRGSYCVVNLSTTAVQYHRLRQVHF